MSDIQLQQAALLSKAWPFEEARRIKPRVSADGEIIFQTGYGPSGLPHLGTFAEVLRTSMVRHAFSLLNPDVPTRLICFSDDMDALRSVPDNIPNASMLEEHLGKPLTQVPDPFGKHESFAAHNNARLRDFLDRFGFEYEFASSTDYYLSGRFDDVLLQVLRSYDEIMKVMLPTLGEERQKSYAPFLPVCPKSGKVLMVPIAERDVEQGVIRYQDPDDGALMETHVAGGRCKLQWKVDWAARWAALGVDYEMAGKDLIDSVALSGKICRILGSKPPAGFAYELFLDANGEKISKSRGNGMTIDEWLRYASPESLSLFVYREPRRAKRLYFDVIPRNVDEYLAHLDAYPKQSAKDRLGNPVWHVHAGSPPAPDVSIEGARLDFQLLLNLVNASNASNAQTLWGFLECYAPGVSPESHPALDSLAHYAIAYYHDFVAPHRKRRAPTPKEASALKGLIERLQGLSPDADAKTVQNEVYAAGKAAGFEELRGWFQALYEILLGEKQGPRFGSFIRFYGIENSIALIRDALDGHAS
ncbi:MAG: lysine--tRNA ligase [Hyphomicrobiales bacterium]|nr:lysine--tRNA ligase [Hyphomicrobiales bacterium]